MSRGTSGGVVFRPWWTAVRVGKVIFHHRESADHSGKPYCSDKSGFGKDGRREGRTAVRCVRVCVCVRGEPFIVVGSAVGFSSSGGEVPFFLPSGAGKINGWRRRRSTSGRVLSENKE